MLIFDINIPRFTPFVNSFCKFSYEFFVNSALRVQIPETGGGCPEWNGSNWLLADASIMRTIRGCNTCCRRGAQNRIGRRGNVVLDSGEPPEGGEKACRYGGSRPRRRESSADTAEIFQGRENKPRGGGSSPPRRRSCRDGERKSPESGGTAVQARRKPPGGRRTAGFYPKNKKPPGGRLQFSQNVCQAIRY